MYCSLPTYLLFSWLWTFGELVRNPGFLRSVSDCELGHTEVVKYRRTLDLGLQVPTIILGMEICFPGNKCHLLPVAWKVIVASETCVSFLSSNVFRWLYWSKRQPYLLDYSSCIWNVTTTCFTRFWSRWALNEVWRMCTYFAIWQAPQMLLK